MGPSAGVLKLTADSRVTKTKDTCRLCAKEADIGHVEIPYIFKFLVTQLSAVNINVKLTPTEI